MREHIKRDQGARNQITAAAASLIARQRMKGSGWRRTEMPRRPADRIRYHYDVERELADRLRVADRKERAQLYASLYDELFERVPDHPQLVLKERPNARTRHVERRLRALRRFLDPESVYLEIGVGDAALASAVSPYVAKVYGIDVSKEILNNVNVAPNVQLVLTDGVSLPVPDQSASVAFSDQVIEHLHLDDVHEHLESVRRALVPGGHYLLATPNRLSGPHDISGAFDEMPTGFHMREYTNAELQALLVNAGFSSVRRGFVSFRRVRVEYPIRLITSLEFVLTRLGPRGRWLARTLPLRLVLGCRLIART